MNFDEMIEQVQERAEIGSRVGAERAVQATLETLAERLAGGEAKDLAAQLPAALRGYLQPVGDAAENFPLDEFFRRVSLREGADIEHASYHARVVCAVIAEAVTMGEIQDIRAQLPADFARLFAVENAGELPEPG